MQELLAALRAARRGDLSARLRPGEGPLAAELAEEWNGFMDELTALTSDLTRVAGEVAGEGRFGGRARVQPRGGAWSALAGGVTGWWRP